MLVRMCFHGLRALQGHKSPVADMAVDASGGLLASSSADRSVRVWDTDGGFCTHVFTGHTCALSCRYRSADISEGSEYLCLSGCPIEVLEFAVPCPALSAGPSQVAGRAGARCSS